MVVLAHYFLYTPWSAVFTWYALIAYWMTGLSWSFLDWGTRNAAIRGHNFFVLTAFCVFVIATITGKDFSPFPRWGVVVIVTAGVLGYAVMGKMAVSNFIRWQKGEFKTNVKDRG